jgi:Arc/MetJ-type ribon-helix-helix transcriptional regulator
MILKWSQSGHRTSRNEPMSPDSRSASTTPRKPVTCRNAIIGGTRGHARTPNFGSSNPTSTAKFFGRRRSARLVFRKLITLGSPTGPEACADDCLGSISAASGRGSDASSAACIPKWYRFGMSTQIAIRLSDEMVAFIDDLVSRGDAASRAAVVSRALERERRRKIAERDAAILAGQPPDADMDALAVFAATTPLEDLD